MSESTSKSASGSKWSRSEVFELLCTLNLNIDCVRSNKAEPSEEDLKTVIENAGTFLCHKVSFASNPKRIQSKLAFLWDNFGDPKGAKSPFALYQNGAFTRTLPDLEDTRKGYPGMLNEIARDLAKHQRAAIVQAKTSIQGQRKSQRKKVRDDALDAIVCKCGFCHNIPTIQCDRCFDWQHTLCYYGTSLIDELPETHLCDQCGPIDYVEDKIIPDEADADFLTAALKDLRVSTENGAYSSHQMRLESKIIEDTTTTSSKNSKDYTAFWGPTDPEIQSIMLRLTLRIETIACLLLKVGVSKRKLRHVLEQQDDANLNVGTLLDTLHGEQFRNKILELLREPIGSSIGIGQMLTGIISSLLIRTVFHNTSPGTSGPLYYALCRNVVDMNGLPFLRQLYRKSMSDVLKTNAGHLEESFASFVNASVTSLQAFLSKILIKDNDPIKIPLTGTARQTWKHLVKEAVSMCMKLKLQLMLSERFYEISTVPIGTTTASMEMFDRAGDFIPEGKIVEICLMPAIIENIPGKVGKQLQDLLANPEAIFLAKDMTDRPSKGTMVSPAIVCLAG